MYSVLDWESDEEKDVKTPTPRADVPNDDDVVPKEPSGLLSKAMSRIVKEQELMVKATIFFRML